MVHISFATDSLLVDCRRLIFLSFLQKLSGADVNLN